MNRRKSSVRRSSEEKIAFAKEGSKTAVKEGGAQIFFILWSFLFMLFAYWQWNDPDPELWISIYIFAATMCALAAARIFFVPVLAIVAVVGLFGGIYFFPDSVEEWMNHEWQQADLSMKTIEMEEARQSFGLLIFSGIVGLAAYTGWRSRSHSGRSSHS